MAIIDNEKFYQSLKDLEVIPEAELDNALASAKSANIFLGDVILEKGLISEENLGKLLSDLTDVPFIDVSNVSIAEDILKIIPEVVAKKQQIIAFRKDEEGLHVAMVDPENIQIKSFIEKKVGIPVKVYLTTKRNFQNAAALYTKDVTQTFEEIISQNINQAKGAKETEPPIIKIVDTIIFYAYQNKASDVHIQPQEDHATIRFRIDGVLHDIVTLPLDIHTQVVTRIKVLSKLRTDEHQAAQDGKLQYQGEGEKIDIRVSIVPITKGEKIVMRLLSERARQLSLTDLGFSQTDLAKLRNAYEKPYGMILATGPTGSGKTTTMYSILKLLNKKEINIATIEDPVEYELGGVSQIQVNTKTNLTFASGLRSILRQDPNIILVGEIRDEETADIAVNSAMTGHLVLSTLHTNDAATTIPRMIDMGIEPFLVSSTVNVIIAQRLVRTIHTVCRISEEVDIKNLYSFFGEKIITKMFPKKSKITLYKGKGCPICHNTGYFSRVGIYEIMEITDSIRSAIVKREDASKIQAIAVKDGMMTMLENGIEKVKEGLTTIEEIMRVTKE